LRGLFRATPRANKTFLSQDGLSGAYALWP
jgi:hypothetical protein